jgi:hypothetical protein
MELYYQYFPPLPEPPKEEVPPQEEQPKEGEIGKEENPQIVEEQNNIQNPDEQNIVDEESLKDPKIAEIVQKYNKILQEKEEEKLKLNSRIDFLENQIKIQNPENNLDNIRESNKKEIITNNKNNFSSTFINGNIVNYYDINNSPKILTKKIIYDEEDNNKFTLFNSNNMAFNNSINYNANNNPYNNINDDNNNNLKNNTLPLNNNFNNTFNNNIYNNTYNSTPYIIPEDQTHNNIIQETNIYQQQNINSESYNNPQQNSNNLDNNNNNNFDNNSNNNNNNNSIIPDNNSVRIMPENNNIINPYNDNDRYKNSGVVKESLNQGEFVSDSSFNKQSEVNNNQMNNTQDNKNEYINQQNTGGFLQEA